MVQKYTEFKESSNKVENHNIVFQFRGNSEYWKKERIRIFHVCLGNLKIK